MYVNNSGTLQKKMFLLMTLGKYKQVVLTKFHTAYYQVKLNCIASFGVFIKNRNLVEGTEWT